MILFQVVDDGLLIQAAIADESSDPTSGLI